MRPSEKWRLLLRDMRPAQTCGHRRKGKRCNHDIGHEIDHQSGDLRWQDDDSDSVDPPVDPPRSLLLSAREHEHPMPWLESLALEKALGKGCDIDWLCGYLGIAVPNTGPRGEAEWAQEDAIKATPWWWRLCWEAVPVPAESGGGMR